MSQPTTVLCINTIISMAFAVRPRLLLETRLVYETRLLLQETRVYTFINHARRKCGKNNVAYMTDSKQTIKNIDLVTAAERPKSIAYVEVNRRLRLLHVFLIVVFFL